MVLRPPRPLTWRGIVWRMRGEVQQSATHPQVRPRGTAVCKTVGFGYPGADPGPATTSENSLLICPCPAGGWCLAVRWGPAETGQLRLAQANMWRSLTQWAVVWPPSPRKAWCIGFRLIGARSGRSSGARPCCAETCPYRLRRGPVDEHAGRRRVGLARGAQPTIGVRTPGQAKQIAALRSIRSTWPPRRRRQPTQLSWRSR